MDWQLEGSFQSIRPLRPSWEFPMYEPNHQLHYINRAANSRELAGRAANPAIAAIHADLARRYDGLAAQPQQGSASLNRRP